MQRILCLHGYGQNRQILYRSLGAIRKQALKSDIEFVFVDAPHVIPDAVEPSVEPPLDKKCWWTRSDGVDDSKYQMSLQVVKETIDSQGPFDGILGFSQGAMLAFLIARMNQQWPFRFYILVSGLKSPLPFHEEYYQPKMASIKMPSLHVIGEADQWVPPEKSEALVHLFENPTVYRHPGGHLVPLHAEARQTLINFILNNKVNR